MDFGSKIIEWYLQNKRDLPWRNTIDPYKIWLSEIILQQTRVDQGLNYYIKFTENFPTVFDLANAPEEKVLKLWQGLGYYSRARNLHFTAKHIVANFNGVFPSDYKSILTLKGVGEYTAAAIASFCFKEPKAVVDGNVYRVLSRVYNINTPIDSTEGKKAFTVLANELIPKKNPDLFNQAIMEFGALNCTKNKPNCSNCCLNANCLAYENNLVDTLPVKKKKLTQKNRYFNFLVITDRQSVLVETRTKKDIWQGLYQFPLIESSENIETFSTLTLPSTINFSKQKLKIHKSEVFKHLLSHQKIYATFWHIEVKTIPNTDYSGIALKNLHTIAVPKLIENYISSTLNFN